MLPYSECKFGLVYVKEFRTVSIVDLDDTNFSEEIYKLLTSNSTRQHVTISATLSESVTQVVTIIQVGPSSNALQSTSKYCFELLHFRNKSCIDILKEIPRFPSISKRPHFRPLNTVRFGPSEPDSDFADADADHEVRGRSSLTNCNVNTPAMASASLPTLGMLPPLSQVVSASMKLPSANSTSEDRENQIQQDNALNAIHLASSACGTPLGQRLPEIESDNRSQSTGLALGSASQEVVVNKKFMMMLLEKVNLLTVTLNALYRDQKMMASELSVLVQASKAKSSQSQSGSAPVCPVSAMRLMPAQNKEEFESLEEEITADDGQREAIVSLLASIGGSDIRTTVFKLVKRIAVTEVLVQFNCEGSCNRLKFPDVFSSLIFDAVRRVWPSSTESSILPFIRKALKNAKDSLRLREHPSNPNKRSKHRASVVSSDED